MDSLRISRVLLPLCLIYVLLLINTNECVSTKSANPSIFNRRISKSHTITHLITSTLGGYDDDDDDDFKTFYYNQTLDHFNYRPESYKIFKQKYVVNSKHWGGPKDAYPIFVYFGGEAALAPFELRGIISDRAADFQAFLVYIEHRYYGESIPFGSKEIAYKNASTLGYLNMEQALADYAEIIWYLKMKFSARLCPVIIYGGSYAGVLAIYFRLKYPHLTIGAWGSSAPVFYYNDINERSKYLMIVTKDFKEASESCYSTIKQSWDIIDRMGSSHEGLKKLSETFNTCSPLKNSDDLKHFLRYTYSYAAQYDAPPEYPVNVICNAIDKMPPGTDPLNKIYAGVIADSPSPCIKVTKEDSPSNFDPFSFQRCTEFYGPTKEITNGTMFQVHPDHIISIMGKEETKDCWGVPPRPHWAIIEFGGQDIKLVLQNFGSNLLFTNGLRDPYSMMGVLENISNSIVALTTAQGSHCLDLESLSSDDPHWLVSHKKEIISIIKKWIDQYNADRKASFGNIIDR